MVASKRAAVAGYLMMATIVLGCAPVASQQRNEGFQPLFNGVNLVGWQARGGHARDWFVESGEIVVNVRSENGGRMIHTVDQYENFELRLEYLVSEGANTGVFMRMGEDGEGLEIQILDDYAERHADLRDSQYTGSLYGMAAPNRRVSKPAGEWQTMNIRVQGQNLTVAVNGTEVVRTDMDQYLATTTNQMRLDALRRRRGYLGLQNYGVPVRFRNIEIRELP